MVGRVVGGMAVVALLLGWGVAGAADSKGCDEIVAAADEAGGSLSAEELAKKVGTDIETVRDCLDKKAKPADQKK